MTAGRWLSSHVASHMKQLRWTSPPSVQVTSVQVIVKYCHSDNFPWHPLPFHRHHQIIYHVSVQYLWINTLLLSGWIPRHFTQAWRTHCKHQQKACKWSKPMTTKGWTYTAGRHREVSTQTIKSRQGIMTRKLPSSQPSVSVDLDGNESTVNTLCDSAVSLGC